MTLDTDLPDPEAARLGWLTTGGSQLMDEARQFDFWTPSSAIRDVLRRAVMQATAPMVMHQLCACAARQTGIAEGAVRDMALVIARHHRLRPIDGPSQLAKRFLCELFADGTSLISTVRGELYAYDGRLWRALPEVELERLLLEVVLTRSELVVGQAPHRAVRAAIRLLKVLQTRLAPWEEGPGPGCIINTLSGEVWIGQDGEAQLRPHRPESGLRALVPVHYDPKAACPRFDQAVADIFAASADRG